jgi:8-oxo-dGTP diphosphatase
MIKIEFYDKGEIEETEMKYVVIVAFYNNKLIIVRHRDRETWEIPGGHKEEFENCLEAAGRELYEETGAEVFDLKLVSTYSVSSRQKTSYGQLYYADVEVLGKLPEMEIEEVKLVNTLPDKLTYPLIQPHLYNKVLINLDL